MALAFLTRTQFFSFFSPTLDFRAENNFHLGKYFHISLRVSSDILLTKGIFAAELIFQRDSSIFPFSDFTFFKLKTNIYATEANFICSSIIYSVTGL